MLDAYKNHCPYCGETIELLVDASMVDEPYIEDCQVCCRPINIVLRAPYADESGSSDPDCRLEVLLRRDDE